MRIVVNIVGGQHVVERIVLEPLRASSEASALTARTQPSVPESAPVHGSRRSLPTALRFGALVAAGASLAVGIGAQLAREDHAAAYNDDARCNYGDVPRSVRCREDRESANAAAIWMGAGYGGAVVFAATFALLSVIDHNDHRTKPLTGRTQPSVPESAPIHASRRSLATAVRFGTLVAAGASLAVGIGAQIAREDHIAAYNDDAQCNHGDVPRSVRCKEDREAANAAAIWMGVGYGGAVVFAATFAVLSVIDHNDHGTKVACTPTFPLGGSCGLVF
jgi:hypothetical protein